MKTVAIYNNKGGIAKTVTAVNFAYNLTEKGYRVLVVDMDPQGNASSFFRRYDFDRPSVKELLTGEKNPDRCARRTGYAALDIVPANFRLREVRADMLARGIETLRNVLDVYSARYDYCIIDCPPSVDFLIEVIMAATDEVIIPLKPDRFSADGLGTVQEVIREFANGKVDAGCLFTQFYRNKDTVKAVHDVIRGSQDTKVYGNVIRRCTAVDHSVSVRKPLLKCASKSAAALDYVDFVEEYLAKEEQQHGIA